MSLVCIGDCHGKHAEYLEITKRYEYTIQLGDFGFNYDVLDKVDSSRHKIICGNHDNYDIVYQYPHILGDFGVCCLGNVEFFYVRGAFSVDKSYRIGRIPKVWWEEEEISYAQGLACLELYATIKPEILLTHSCATRIVKQITNPKVLRNWGFDPDTFSTSTQTLLDGMLEIHLPKIQIFGHYHRNAKVEIGESSFYCLNELNFMILTENV